MPQTPQTDWEVTVRLAQQTCQRRRRAQFQVLLRLLTHSNDPGNDRGKEAR